MDGTSYTLERYPLNNWGPVRIFEDYCRVYSCYFYSNNKPIRWFVPCYRIADGAIGLYDLWNKTFYANQGNGTFIKGSDVAGTGMMFYRPS